MHKVLNIGEQITESKFLDLTYSPTLIEGDWDCIVSYRYRRIIPKAVHQKIRCINLHSSLLPRNRGAHPVFWSIWNNEPIGFTIHIVDSRLDTGPVLLHGDVELPSNFTLYQAWERVNYEMVQAFCKDAVEYCSPRRGGYQPEGIESFHSKADITDIFPYLPNGWDTLIADIPAIKALYYIDKIEQVRTKNNINWMDVLRVAVKADPTNAISLIRKISECDNEINQLLRQI